MLTNEKPVIKSITSAQGCLRQAWTARKANGGRSIDTHRAVVGLALLDDGTLDLIIELNGEVKLRADAEAWVRSTPNLAPDSFGNGRSTQYDPTCDCRGRTVERKDLTADEVAEAFDLAAEADEAGR
jgi:hypothetical protein